jgi:hypothetical protein
MKLISACKKTLCWIRKRRVRGLRRQKKRSLQFVNEHFSDKRNEEIGVFLPTLINGFVQYYNFQEICFLETNFLVRKLLIFLSLQP